MSQGDYELLTAVEDAGGRFVLDATEAGERTLPAPVDVDRLQADPREELVRIYFDCIPDVFQRPNDRMFAWLREQVAQRGVRGIVVRRYVWCDHWHGEMPRLREELAVPLLEWDGAGNDPRARPAPSAGWKPFWRCCDERDRAAHHARRVGPASCRCCGPAGCLRAGLRRAAAPPRRGRQLAPAQAPHGQLPRGAAPLELPALRRRAAPSSPKARQTARRHDEGPGDRARDGLLSGRHRGVLRRRRVVAAVPHGEPHGDAGIGRPTGHRRLVLPRAGDARRLREQGPFPLARPRHLQRGGDLRRHGGDCPAAGRLGLRHLLVGDAASPAPGRRASRP